MEELVKSIAVFANPNDSNEYTKTVLTILAQRTLPKLQVVSLEEKLPDYTRFPSEDRKSRIEEILEAAAHASAASLVEFARELGIKCDDAEMLKGRFPIALLDWIKASGTSLLIKESLASDGRYGYASKGDIKLTRQSPAPVLLAHAPMKKGDSVLIGIAPLPGDPSADRLCLRLIEIGKQWAKLLGGPLHIVHAWELWGENLLRSRVSENEIKEAVSDAKSLAAAAFDRVIAQSDLSDLTVDRFLGRGDPTRVINGAIDVVKPGLVVLGSAANDGIKGVLLGNTAESIVRSKQCSVLIAR